MSEKTYEELSDELAFVKEELARYKEDHRALLDEQLDMEAKLKKAKDQSEDLDSFVSELDCECAKLRGENEVWEKVFSMLYPNNIGSRGPNTGA